MAVTETRRGVAVAVVVLPAAATLVRRGFPLPVESSPLGQPSDAVLAPVLALVLLGVSLSPRRPAAAALRGDVGERPAGAGPASGESEIEITL